MASSGKIEIEKFNGQSFKLWKLKLEDLLMDKVQWIAVDLGTKPKGVSNEEWKKLDGKAKSIIRLCVSDSVFLNVLGEATMKDLWEKLGNLYQSKSLVNKLFLRKKLYNLRMKDGESVTEHLNTFNIVVSQLTFVDIKILDEDKCISLLCSLPDSWDSLVIAIGSNATALQFDEIVSSLLAEEMRRKNMEIQNGDAFSIRGWFQNRNKNKSSSGRSKSIGKPVKVVCWKWEKEGHYKRDCKSKTPDKGKGYDDAPSAKVKTTSDEGGDVYLASSSTHVDHEAWLIDSGVNLSAEQCPKTQEAEEDMSRVPYASAVSSLMYAMVCTRPDIAHVVRVLSRFMSKPRREHWTAVKRVFRLKEFKALVENQTEKKIKVLRIDNGGEFCSKEFEEFCKKCGIARQKNNPYTPQQNGVAERTNKTLMERARSMLSVVGLGQGLWVEAMEIACYLVNRSPSSALEDKTPQEVWTGKKPSLSHLRVFGFDAYVHVPKEK
eukprot:PITA_14701